MIGIVILGLLAMQPLMKLHFFHDRIPRIMHLVHMHLWFGRILLTLGIIDGGLGFHWAESFHIPQWPAGWKIAYGVAAALVWIVYVSVVLVWVELKKPARREKEEEDGGKAGTGEHEEDMAALSQHPGFVAQGSAPDVEKVCPPRPRRPDDRFGRFDDAKGDFKSYAL